MVRYCRPRRTGLGLDDIHILTDQNRSNVEVGAPCVFIPPGGERFGTPQIPEENRTQSSQTLPFPPTTSYDPHWNMRFLNLFSRNSGYAPLPSTHPLGRQRSVNYRLAIFMVVNAVLILLPISGLVYLYFLRFYRPLDDYQRL